MIHQKTRSMLPYISSWSAIVLPMVVLLMIGFTADLTAQDQNTPENQTATEPATRHLVVVQGVAGGDQYATRFEQWSQQWLSAANVAGFRVTSIDGSNTEKGSDQELQETLLAANQIDELWLVMIGHGTFDGETAKFNLVGDDVSAKQLAEWLKSRDKMTVIVNCSACSSPFVDELSGKNRIVITSTKSGYESSFSHFGQFLAETISASDVDLDKDEQMSLLEAVIVASSKTTEFYKADSRLETEHALIEDNSDSRGTPLSWYRGVRVTKQAKDGTPADGTLPNQIYFAVNKSGAGLSPAATKTRNRLENEIEQLRASRSKLTEDQYYQQLEEVMVQLAQLYRAAESEQADPGSETGATDGSDQ